jgi:hypothetical protein
MLQARTVAGFRTRRPRERPKSFPLDVRVGDEFVTQETKAAEFPALLTLPLLAPPASLYPREVHQGIEIVGYETIAFGTSPYEAISTTGGSGIRQKIEWNVQSYTRLLAKIALGFAVSVLGPLPLEEVPILPIIFGNLEDVGHWMGTTNFRLEIEDRAPTHALGLHVATSSTDPRAGAVFVRLKMFANSGASGNEIVVWTTSCLPPHLVTRHNTPARIG